MNRQQALWLYIGMIGCTTGSVLGGAVLTMSHLGPARLLSLAPTALFFVVLGCLTSSQYVYLGESNMLAMGTTAQVATMLLFPYPVAIAIVGLAKTLSILSLTVQDKIRSWRAGVINLGNTVLAIATAGAAFHVVPGHQYLWSPYRAVLAVPALTSLGFLYHAIEVLIVVGAISLSHRDSPWSVFRATFRAMLLPQVSLIFIGIIFAVLWHYSPLLSLLIVVPIILSTRSFESVARLRKETVEAVVRMAENIEYRDTGTYEHSQRLADLTRRLSIAIGLTPENATEVVLAARVHDLGKIGISSDILLKQGPLTPSERQIMQGHPAIGADILASYSAFQSSAHIVRHHHERWDGRGYPDGLKADEIPLGSRVIAVVDAFDSMTADRPYRRGMSVDAAVTRLKDGIGSQFDPRICAAFVQLLIEEGIYQPLGPQPQLHIVRPEAG